MQSQTQSLACRAAGRRGFFLFLLAALLISAPGAEGAVPPEGDPVAERAIGDPDLFIHGVHQPLADLPASLADRLRGDLSALGVSAELGHYDVRGGRWGSLVLSAPLVPGPGLGNRLTWSALGLAPPANAAAYRNAVAQAFTAYLRAKQARLGVDPAELGAPSIGAYEKNRLVHVYAPRVYGGVPVRDSFVRATLNSGNLVLYGTRNWGAIDISTTPGIAAEVAQGVVASHLSGLEVSEWTASELAIVPLANGAQPDPAAPGNGYLYRLVWAVGARVDGSQGSWEALVDAQTGELLSFHDRNSYVDQKSVVGGIFPVSNDGQSPGGVPDGVEQPGYPMSRAYVFQGATQLTANSEGLVTVPGGAEYRTSLTGPFIRIQDQCGAINEVTTCDVLDLATSAGTDCARPLEPLCRGHPLGAHRLLRAQPRHRPGQELARADRGGQPAGGRLDEPPVPGDHEHQQRLQRVLQPDRPGGRAPTGSINFYRSGSLGSNVCRNTGEIPAVFDHEWGHGLDTFDDSPGRQPAGRGLRRHDRHPQARTAPASAAASSSATPPRRSGTAPATATSAWSAPECARWTG